jgi:hypothetical protein
MYSISGLQLGWLESIEFDSSLFFYAVRRSLWNVSFVARNRYTPLFLGMLELPMAAHLMNLAPPGFSKRFDQFSTMHQHPNEQIIIHTEYTLHQEKSIFTLRGIKLLEILNLIPF